MWAKLVLLLSVSILLTFTGAQPSPFYSVIGPDRLWCKRSSPADIINPIAADLYNALNAERRKASLNVLYVNPLLATAAQSHAQSMQTNKFFSHVGLDGLNQWQRIQKAGYAFTQAEENIARAQENALKVVQDWMLNSFHRSKILNPNFTEFGVGVAGTSTDYYYTADFGARTLDVCGDGILTGIEQCDDLARKDGDGCSANCTEEPNWKCLSYPLDAVSTCCNQLLDPLVWNWTTYLQLNYDLIPRPPGLSLQQAALNDWLDFGSAEGRQAHENFYARYFNTTHHGPFPNYHRAIEAYLDGVMSAPQTVMLDAGRPPVPPPTPAPTPVPTPSFLLNPDFLLDDPLHPAVFNFTYYLKKYPDLPAVGITSEIPAKFHWLRDGIREGRQGSAEFWSVFYVNYYEDLKALQLSANYSGAISHYLRFGRQEGRKGADPPRPELDLLYDPRVFDAEFYYQTHSDLLSLGIRTIGALRFHWTYHGLDEGRQAHPYFDPKYYLAQNPDVAAAVGPTNYWDGLYHYLNLGFKENRTAAAPLFVGLDLVFLHYSVFNVSFYGARYPDLTIFEHSHEVVLKRHWISHGIKEGRRGAHTFDPPYYLSHNPDLFTAFGNNYTAAVLHYVYRGRFEARSVAADYVAKK